MRSGSRVLHGTGQPWHRRVFGGEGGICLISFMVGWGLALLQDGPGRKGRDGEPLPLLSCAHLVPASDQGAPSPSPARAPVRAPPESGVALSGVGTPSSARSPSLPAWFSRGASDLHPPHRWHQFLGWQRLGEGSREAAAAAALAKAAGGAGRGIFGTTRAAPSRSGCLPGWPHSHPLAGLGAPQAPLSSHSLLSDPLRPSCRAHLSPRSRAQRRIPNCALHPAPCLLWGCLPEAAAVAAAPRIWSSPQQLLVPRPSLASRGVCPRREPARVLGNHAAPDSPPGAAAFRGAVAHRAAVILGDQDKVRGAGRRPSADSQGREDFLRREAQRMVGAQ